MKSEDHFPYEITNSVPTEDDLRIMENWINTPIEASLDKAKPSIHGFTRIQKDLRACKMIKCNDCDTWKYFSNELNTYPNRKPCNEKTCKIGHVHNLQNMVLFANPTFTKDKTGKFGGGFDLIEGVCMKCFYEKGYCGGY